MRLKLFFEFVLCDVKNSMTLFWTVSLSRLKSVHLCECFYKIFLMSVEETSHSQQFVFWGHYDLWLVLCAQTEDTPCRDIMSRWKQLVSDCRLWQHKNLYFVSIKKMYRCNKNVFFCLISDARATTVGNNDDILHNRKTYWEQRTTNTEEIKWHRRKKQKLISSNNLSMFHLETRGTCSSDVFYLGLFCLWVFFFLILPELITDNKKHSDRSDEGTLINHMASSPHCLYVFVCLFQFSLQRVNSLYLYVL